MDSAIRWINHYPLDNSIGFASVYPLDSDLSGTVSSHILLTLKLLKEDNEERKINEGSTKPGKMWQTKPRSALQVKTQA